MQFTPQGSMLVLVVLVFVAVALLAESLYLLWKSYRGEQARKLQQRLHAVTAARRPGTQAPLLKQRALSDLPVLERTLRQMARARHLERMLLQAGLEWTVSRLLLACLALGLAGALATASLAHQGTVFAAAVGCLFAAMPLLYVQRRRQRRLARME